MCSETILLAHSCYIDNFALIFSVITKALVMGIVIGTVVGILLFFTKKLTKEKYD